MNKIHWIGRLPRNRAEAALQQLQREIDEVIRWRQVISTGLAQSEPRKEAIKKYMIANEVVALHSPNGAVALVQEVRSSQPDRDKARRILTPEQYREIFESLPLIKRLTFQEI